MSTDVLLKVELRSSDSRQSLANLAPSNSVAPSLLALPPKLAKAAKTSRSSSFGILLWDSSLGGFDVDLLAPCLANNLSKHAVEIVHDALQRFMGHRDYFVVREI